MERKSNDDLEVGFVLTVDINYASIYQPLSMESRTRHTLVVYHRYDAVEKDRRHFNLESPRFASCASELAGKCKQRDANVLNDYTR